MTRGELEGLGFHTEDNGECFNLQQGWTLIGVYPWTWDSGLQHHFKVAVDGKEIFLGFIMDVVDLQRLIKREGILL